MKDTWTVDANQPDGPRVFDDPMNATPYIDDLVDDWMGSPVNNGETLEIKVTYKEAEVQR